MNVHSNKDARKTLREWGTKGFPMVVAEGYTSRFKSRYVIYQWNAHGAIFHANFFYPV